MPHILPPLLAADFCSCDNFWTFFISFISGSIDGPHLQNTWLDFGWFFYRDLELQFSSSNMEFAISQPKMIRLPQNKKQPYRFNSRPQMGPSGLILAMTLILNFQGQIWNSLYRDQKLSDCHETKNKHIDWTLGLQWNHQVSPQPWPWPWIFKVK